MTKKSAGALPVPVLQAMVLADHVYTDIRSRNSVIAGTFNTIPCKHFEQPVRTKSYELYICLTDVRGTIEFEVRWIDLSTNEALFTIQGMKITSQDPLQGCEAIVQIPFLIGPHPGAYALELHCSGVLIAAKRVFFVQESKST